MKTITLTRFAYAPDGTFGVLTLPGGWSCVTYIMIHPGNWPSNFKGCIGVGKRYTAMQGANAQIRAIYPNYVSVGVTSPDGTNINNTSLDLMWQFSL